VVRPEHGAHLLGVEALGLRGEPHKIHEDDGDDAPLVTRR